ncbi:DUF5672 family protein [Butyrivibrio sp.]|uniref:DUF5672 family protein n=1 Tax=Butyrivibrio sp. TaxID=28121 RepID=UPI0025C11604|nr:DUF5672 family protein [Butyrivibrio sp.]MBQ9301565.1 hypothetical protein [Butyrivibrio sp.]
MRNDIIILIPRYKEELNAYEKISLNSCLHCLRDYPKYFMSPKSLLRTRDCYGLNTEYFDDYYFSSTKAYSELLIKKEFYSRFAGFKYILIFQLDAYVFRDDLELFMNMDYDYIGAPMPSFDLYSICGYLHDKVGYVGNGGFSLRKVTSFIRALDHTDEVLDDIGWDKGEYLGEDILFSLMGLLEKYSFRVPSIDVAEKFAMQFDLNDSYMKLDSGILPFATHGWSQPYYIGLWEKYIFHNESSDLLSKYSYKEDYFERWAKPKFVEYLLGKIAYESEAELEKALSVYAGRDIIIWGCGFMGERCFNKLSRFGLKPALIYDTIKQGKSHGVRVVNPYTDINGLRNPYIIVTPIRGRNAIIEDLTAKGYVQGADFIVLEDLFKSAIDNYYNNYIWNIYIFICRIEISGPIYT